MKTKRKKSMAVKEREAWMALLLSEARMVHFVYAKEREEGDSVLLHHNTNVLLRQRLVTEFGLDLDALGVGGDELYWAARQKVEAAAAKQKLSDDALQKALKTLEAYKP